MRLSDLLFISPPLRSPFINPAPETSRAMRCGPSGVCQWERVYFSPLSERKPEPGGPVGAAVGSTWGASPRSRPGPSGRLAGKLSRSLSIFAATPAGPSQFGGGASKTLPVSQPAAFEILAVCLPVCVGHKGAGIRSTQLAHPTAGGWTPPPRIGKESSPKALTPLVDGAPLQGDDFKSHPDHCFEPIFLACSLSATERHAIKNLLSLSSHSYPMNCEFFFKILICTI